MWNRVVCGAASTLLLGVPMTAAAAQWVPGSEIVGQTVQVETSGTINNITFEPGGSARISTPRGAVVQGTWAAANGQLCLNANGGQVCWRYQAPLRAGQQMTMVSSCNVSSQWLAMGTNEPAARGERG